MERENAEMALLITLEPPTAPMEQEAVAAGFYEPEAFPGTQFPRVQIATIEDILNENGPQIPRLGLSEAPTFRRAPRRRRGEWTHSGCCRGGLGGVGPRLRGGFEKGREIRWGGVGNPWVSGRLVN